MIWAIAYLLNGLVMLILILIFFRKYSNYIGIIISKNVTFGLILPFFILNFILFAIEGILIAIYNMYIFPIWLITLYGILIYLLIIYYYKNIYSRYKLVPSDFKQYDRRDFGPYLLYGKEPTQSMTILWSSKRPKKENSKNQKSILKFGKNIHKLSNNVDIYPENKKKSLIKSITLKNLNADSKYYYKIPNNKSIYSFETAPENINKSNFNFIFVSDLHANEANISPFVNFCKNTTPNCKFIISAGDNISNAKNKHNWRIFFNQLKEISPFIPFLSCPGNHDGEFQSYSQMWNKFFPYPYPEPKNGNYYSFTYLNCYFIFLDLYNAGQKFGYPSSFQLKWLKDELENMKNTIIHKFLILHNSIYCSGEFGFDNELEKILIPLIIKHKIHYIISGHAHIFEVFHRTDINSPTGAYFIVSGGGGGNLDHFLLDKKQYLSAPYKWENLIHIAKKKPYLEGNPNSKFRNDFILKNYQVFGKISHQFLRFSIKNNKISFQAIDYMGKIIFDSKK